MARTRLDAIDRIQMWRTTAARVDEDIADLFMGPGDGARARSTMPAVSRVGDDKDSRQLRPRPLVLALQ